MSSYEQGFIEKCAELGVNPFSLLKVADEYDNLMSDYIRRSRTIPANAKPDWKKVPQPKSPAPKPAPKPAPAPQPGFFQRAYKKLRSAGNFVASSIPGNPLKK